MAPIPPPDLDAPWSPDKLIQLRTSKMKPMRNLSIQTGIYKQPRLERVYVSSTGLQDDEHDLVFHGGVEKAIHQYFAGHYTSWRKEWPGSAHLFEVGAFGENLVTGGNMNERNVCIGDKIRVGSEDDGVLLEISLPRQPCFKLNHRFELKGFASQTWKKSRTGWYYRVLKEGRIGVGDEVVLVERPNPKWTIERIQEYLHRDTSNLPMLEELARISSFGNECKGAFTRMVRQLKKAEEGQGKDREVEQWSEFSVVEKKAQSARITSLVLEKVGDGAGDELDPGCFARLELPNGLIRPYSIVSGDTHRFELGIALEDPSRGGSSYLHKTLQQGDTILVGKITESVPCAGQASNHIFIAGGIGVTAFLMHAHVYDQINWNYEMHYAVRCGAAIPFPSLLAKMGSKLKVYDASKNERLNIEAVLRDRKWNSYIYTCGPQRMIDEVVRASNACAISQDDVHYEAFSMQNTGDPFTVELSKSRPGETVPVKSEQTLLQVMRESGLDVESSCEVGNCGTCRVEVCEGRVEHRGSALTEEEKRKGAMLSCVSRGVGHIVVDY